MSTTNTSVKTFPEYIVKALIPVSIGFLVGGAFFIVQALVADGTIPSVEALVASGQMSDVILGASCAVLGVALFFILRRLSK